MTFAFLVHPRADVARDLGRMWRPLRLVPDTVYDATLRRVTVPPVRVATVHFGGRDAPLVGHVILVPFGARNLLADPRAGSRRVSAAVDRAVELRCSIVGLGGLTAPITAGGMSLRRRTDIGVTNGNAFTAAIVYDQLINAIAHAPRGRVGIVGATGSVESAVAALVARDGAADEITLVARSQGRLDALVDQLTGSRVSIRAATALESVADCDVVVLLTASAETIIQPRHLARGAVVIDATQPRNTSPSLIIQRPDVTLIDGGIVEVPSMQLTGSDIGLPRGRSYACMAETMLLSLAGHHGHFCLGRATLDRVEHIRAIACSFAHLGFHASAPTSFGRPLIATAAAA